MRSSYILYLFVFLFGMTQSGYTQTTDPMPVDNINVIPPSPNAASLGKYGAFPVNYYSGTPEISIPLTGITARDFQLPISLSYHASGFKVEEQASWVGFGWALNAGGVITRNVRGLPDEYNDGTRVGYNVTRNQVAKYENNTATATERATFQERLAKGLWDGEPDQIFFNFNGRSGQIVSDMSGNPIVSPRQALKITGSIDTGFTITDEKGVQYMFAEQEISYQEDGCDLTPLPGFVSSLYLSAIVLPNGRTISLSYASGITYINIDPQQTAYQLVGTGDGNGSCTGLSNSQCKKIYRIETKRLATITDGKTLLQFKATTQRTDLPQNSNEYRLDSIALLYDNVPSRSFKFSYGTYTGGRLKLLSVREYSGNIQKAPYTFEYYVGTTPLTTSYSQDHWGYFNAASNTSKIPTGYYFALSGARVVLPGANRSPNTNAINGVLRKIIYPTGGNTIFNFELNDYGYINQQAVTDYVTEGHSIQVEANPSNMTESVPFTINLSQDVTLNYGVNQYDGGGTVPSTTEYIQLYKDGSLLETRASGTGALNLYLNQGNYELIAYSENPTSRTYASMSYLAQTNVEIKKRPTGGIRVTSIIDDDGMTSKGKITRLFSYRMPEDTARSSGVISGEPKYDYNYQVTKSTGDCSYYVRTAVSDPLGNTKGGHIGYRYVTVTTDNGAKSVYSYTTFYDFPDPQAQGYPFAIHLTDDHKRGNLIESIDYKKTGSIFSPVRRVRNVFEINEQRNYNGNTAYRISHVRYNANPALVLYSEQKYKNETWWVYLKQSTETTFASEGTDSIVQVKTYYYDNPSHMQLSRSESTRSDGIKEVNVLTYPLDYSSGTGFIDDLNNSHMIAFPVEQVVAKDSNGIRQIISGSINEYKTGGKGYPAATYLLALPSVVAQSAFKFSHRSMGVFPPDGNSSGYLRDSRYQQRMSFDSYDADGNLLQYSKDNFPVSFIYGYENHQAIAEVKGASYAEVAYTSFEEEGSGNWTISGSNRVATMSRTGKKCYDLSTGQISKSGLDASKRYVISFWARTNAAVNVNNTLTSIVNQEINGWTYHQRVISGSSSIIISGSGNIDELRLSPQVSQIATYTYDPLKGISSQQAMNGLLYYYEYDGLGRLSAVRDSQGRILKALNYQYYQQ